MTQLHDGRGAAWMAAWDRMDSAQDLIREWSSPRKQPRGADEPFPPAYWALINEAKIFASLAQVAPDIGIIVGTELSRRRDEELEESNRAANEVFGDAEGMRDRVKKGKTKDRDILSDNDDEEQQP